MDTDRVARMFHAKITSAQLITCTFRTTYQYFTNDVSMSGFICASGFLMLFTKVLFFKCGFIHSWKTIYGNRTASMDSTEDTF